MGRSIEVTHTGAYIVINVSQEKFNEVLNPRDIDFSEWINDIDENLYHEGEMDFNVICSNNHILSDNIQSSDIEKLKNDLKEESKEFIEKISELFGSENILIKVGVFEYEDEIG